MFGAWEIQEEYDGMPNSSRNWNGGACWVPVCCERECRKPRWLGEWSRWAEQLQLGGRQALKSAGRIGRKPRLGPAELKRIVRGLERGPEALGYETGLWTAWRVPQRPSGRALERDEEKIRRWKQQRWPEIKKKPKKKGASSSSSTKAD